MKKPADRQRQKGRLLASRRVRETKIDLSEIPELSDDFWQNAELGVLASKIPVSIRLDEEVLAWFKSQGPGYQTRINAVLKSFIRHASKQSNPQ